MTYRDAFRLATEQARLHGLPFHVVEDEADDEPDPRERFGYAADSALHLFGRPRVLVTINPGPA